MHTRPTQGPERTCFTFHTHVHCDGGCGAVETLVSFDADTEERRQAREALAIARAAEKGWQGQRCPRCSRFADGTAPGTVIADEGGWLLVGEKR